MSIYLKCGGKRIKMKSPSKRLSDERMSIKKCPEKSPSKEER